MKGPAVRRSSSMPARQVRPFCPSSLRTGEGEPMKLSGYEHFDAPVETVLRPNHESRIHGEDSSRTWNGLRNSTPTHLECRVKPPLWFLAGSMQMVFDVTESNRPSSAKMRVKGKGIGASLTIETSIKLSPEMDGTRLEWSSQVTELGGLIKARQPLANRRRGQKDRQRLLGHFPQALERSTSLRLRQFFATLSRSRQVPVSEMRRIPCRAERAAIFSLRISSVPS